MVTNFKQPPVYYEPHLQWLRTLMCCVRGCLASTPSEAAHCRRGTDGGMGMKPSDRWAVPLCKTHHREQHRGERTFSRRHGIDMREAAKEYARASPHRAHLGEIEP